MSETVTKSVICPKCRQQSATNILISANTVMEPDIRKAVGNQLLVIADGGIEDGFDAFKVMALGADAVSVGKALMKPLEEGGAPRMTKKIQEMNDELKAMMVRSGIKDIKHMDPTVIHSAAWL